MFAPRPVPEHDLAAMFEAARWAPSSFNEQPRRYIVGVADAADHDDTHARILATLFEGNQIWARHAPVLALGIAVHTFATSGKTNKAAVHDLGLASAHLVVEATVRGLSVHQMIGLDPVSAAEAFAVPDGAEVVTALAIGYADEHTDAAPELRKRESKPRTRQSTDEFVFAGRYGQAASL
ncbi:nitroreductase family protein [Salinisphaera orenii]|uniref:nitroreductase family protein n=1 Tax=Salinisphaera orenii TaxID=856731 RepID=UPI00195510E2